MSVVLLTTPMTAVATHDDTARLPDLGMARLRKFSIEKRPNGNRWLRFTTIIVNVGDGPFRLRGYGLDAGGELKVRQRILSGSRFVPHDTAAKMYYAGDGHDHWHVRDLAQYVLEGQNGAARLYGEKHGFCFFDNYVYNSALPGFRSTPTHPPSRVCWMRRDGSVLMGLSVGWGDKYPAWFVDQYIKLGDLPAGEYTLTATADWANWFVELDDTNNSTTARLRITGTTVTVLNPGSGA